MIADYDFTVLVTATPPKHTSSKQVIVAVNGWVDITEVDHLAHAATILHNDGERTRKVFTSTVEGAFEHVGQLSPGIFSDGPEGLPFLQRRRLSITERLRGLPQSVRRTQFHPGAKIVSHTEFGRVEPWASGATPLQMGVVEQARRVVEEQLGQYIIMGGDLFRRSQEPFLVLSSDENLEKFKLSVQTDVRVAVSDGKGYLPIACFGLHDAKSARNYAASLVQGARPKVKWDGVKVLEVNPNHLYGDPCAMTLRAAAERMRQGFIEMVERSGNVEDALTRLPLPEIIAFRGLSDALLNSWFDIDVIDTAVASCLQYEENGGRNIFSSDDQVLRMLEMWHDRPMGMDLSGTLRNIPRA
jgi:hypothetical protein